MLPAAVFPVAPGERVLDLCAAPGGKATELAAKLQGQGFLAANEISASRAKALLKNLEVSGVVNAVLINAPANRLAEEFPGAFDRILVDAPCSGEGMFRKDAANARAWSRDKVELCAKIQRDITQQAVRMLRPGGLLLYSTCTFSPEENEGTAAYLLRQCPQMELLPIPGLGAFSEGRQEYLDLIGTADTPGSGGTYRALCDAGILGGGAGGQSAGAGVCDLSVLKRCVRVFPHRAEGEGHFLALFRKGLSAQEDGRPFAEKEGASARKSGGPSGGRRRLSGNREQISAEERLALQNFWSDLSERWDIKKVQVLGGQAYYMPETFPAVGRLPFLRSGLYLGELRRGRFEPSQAFAMAMRADDYASSLDFAQDDARVLRYLCGETVQADGLQPARADGWQLVTVCGFPLGWGKLVNGTLKNKYHPGWRMLPKKTMPSHSQ